jgi:hypothetical protein
MTDAWLADVGRSLDVDTDVIDVDSLLRLARDVAHGVERKAAPLTTFVVGYAAGARGADSDGVAELARLIRDMCPPEEDASD